VSDSEELVGLSDEATRQKCE